jgi:tetratricopeptide (TPR) repeat protein
LKVRALLAALLAIACQAQVHTAFQRGVAAYRRGDLEASRAEFMRVIGSYKTGSVRDASQIADAAEAYQMLGLIHEADATFQAAAKLNPKSTDVFVRWGKLCLQAWDEPEAVKQFEAALKLDPTSPGALTGLAEIRSDQWDGTADELAKEALKTDPEYVPAMVLEARLALEDEKPDAAAADVARALKTDPDSLEALAMSAAESYQRGDAAETQKRIDAVLKRNPHYGEMYFKLAHFAALHRQIREARDFLNLAVDKDPELWKAWSELGITELRLGHEDEARKALETAFHGDPFNPWTVNSLKLMDSYALFERFDTPDFHVKLQKKEAGVMRPYVEELLERALGTFEKEYGYKPPEKVIFEMFPDHEDFAVRTLGVPGLGALGASFGTVVAMDSPAGRPPGEFHWGSTLWHEVAHVVTLGSTNNRIPRWFTEGLSVYEETRAGWGDPIDLDDIKQLQQDHLMTVANLNKGFVRPTYAGQVQFAYFEAGMLCRFIVEKYGFDKVLALMAAYKDGAENVAALEKVLGKPTTDLDKEFRAYLDAKTGSVVKAIDFKWHEKKSQQELQDEVARNPGNFFAQIHLAHDWFEAANLDAALLHANAARKLFPEFTGEGNAYELAAKIDIKRDDNEAAARELLLWVAAGGRDPETAKKLASILTFLKRPKEAAQVLEGFLYIVPQDPEIHSQLGALYLDLAQTDPIAGPRAIREYTVALAMKPIDMAGAHFNLARAYVAAHRNAEARSETLASLEVAPNFGPAQKLLLELTDSEGTTWKKP